jgi:hypothetical protein
VRYETAIRRLRTISAQQAAGLWEDEPFLIGVYAFGAVLDAPHRRGGGAGWRSSSTRPGREASLAHLRRVEAGYWDRGWRNTHRGSGIYPENHLWDAVHGYLDLIEASRHLSDKAGRAGAARQRPR